MKTARLIARIVAGLVFIFSGITKGVDPLGSMYKFIDYFTAFGLDSLNHIALALGIILCTAEFIIGFLILTGIRVKLASWGLLAFMVVFTPLTFILALNNPVSDCGCFGDAIHLTNWQTFFKNIVILIPVIFIFIERDRFPELSGKTREWVYTSLVTIIFVSFIIFNYLYLPIIDFRPYHPGVNIMEAMSMPEGAESDEYGVILIYEKDGVEEEFTLDNYPSDPEWVFVDQKSFLIKKGYTPPIHDFSLSNIYGEDMTDLVLGEPGYTLIMISKKLSEATPLSVIEGLELGNEAVMKGLGFYVLTSSSTDEVLGFGSDHTFLSGDETTIKTIIRANPGYLLLSDGVILKKWSYRSVKGIETITDSIGEITSKKAPDQDLRLAVVMAMSVLLAIALNSYLRKK